MNLSTSGLGFTHFLAVSLAIASPNGYGGGDDAFNRLVGNLDSSDAYTRFAAVERLVGLDDSRVLEVLIDALETDIEKRTGISMAIIPALGFIGDDRAVPVLIRCLEIPDGEWLGREDAARALGEIGSKTAVPVLLKAVGNVETRDAALKALASIGDARGAEALISAFIDGGEKQGFLIQGLWIMGDEIVPKLTEALDIVPKGKLNGYKRAEIVAVLGRIGSPLALQTIARLGDDPSPEVRLAVKSALAAKH